MFGGADYYNIYGATVTVGWHYVVAVQDGSAGTRTLYVDGSQSATGIAKAASYVPRSLTSRPCQRSRSN
jgi:hypothetical protein